MSQGCPPWAKNKKTLQNLHFWSCKASSIAIELTLPRLKSTIGNINDYIWSKHVDFHLKKRLYTTVTQPSYANIDWYNRI